MFIKAYLPKLHLESKEFLMSIQFINKKNKNRLLFHIQRINTKILKATPKLQFFSPIVGLNYNNFMIAYTYSQVAGAVRFDNGGYHQITLGLNLFCKREKYECNCPAIN